MEGEGGGSEGKEVGRGGGVGPVSNTWGCSCRVLGHYAHRGEGWAHRRGIAGQLQQLIALLVGIVLAPLG